MPDDSYRPEVKVKRSSAGLGLFAAEDIPKEQLIIEYTGDRINEEEKDRRGGKYIFEVKDNLFIDGKDRKNIARYVNHSCAQNAEAEHDEDEDKIYFRSIKKISSGEEITIDYGKEYVDEHIKPYSCRCAKCSK